MRISLLSTILFVTFAGATFASPTISCHCFQERQYLPQKSHAADPYFLATTRNSLMAVIYSVEKKSLVKARMSGADSDLLWISQELARQSGLSKLAIEEAYRETGSWQQVVDQLQIGRQLDAAVMSNLKQPELLVNHIVDGLLTAHLEIQPAQLQPLREQGVNNKELILLVFLSRIGGEDPAALLRRYKSGESWGKLLHDLGVYDGSGVERTWRVMLSE